MVRVVKEKKFRLRFEISKNSKDDFNINVYEGSSEDCASSSRGSIKELIEEYSQYTKLCEVLEGLEWMRQM